MNHSPSRQNPQTGRLTLCSIILSLIFGLAPFILADEPLKVNINNEGDLRNVILEMNRGDGPYSTLEKVEFVLTSSIVLSQNLEINVSTGRTAFVFTSTDGRSINGQGEYGFIISTTEDSPVSFENLIIADCIAQGKGNNFNSGGAIFVESGNVSFLDIRFTNNSEDAIFAGGNITFHVADKTTIGPNQSIGGPAGTTSLADSTEAELAAIKESVGDVSVVGGGTLILQSENTYLGKTVVVGSTVVLQNGKAIHDQAEVALADGGVLELRNNETIGYLSSSEDSEVRLFYTDDLGNKIGAKTLTIGGDEYSFALPGNGKTILGDTITAFNGKIATDHNRASQEFLVKTGTGMLILGGDNTNTYEADGETYQDDFTTKLENGTIQLNHAKALGGGMLIVSSTDSELGRNMLQIGREALRIRKVESTEPEEPEGEDEFHNTLKLENKIQITTQTPFRVGVADDLKSEKDFTLDLVGQVVGNGSIMMNMGNKEQVLTLSNHDATQANQISQVQLNVGTLSLTGVQNTETGQWTTGVGNATIAALLGSGNQTALRIDTQGLIIGNNMTIHSSGLTITNGIDEGTSEYVSEFTLTGQINGTGGLNIDLHNASDTIIFGGQLINGGAVYTGNTNLIHGTLKLEQVSKTIQFAGGLALSRDAVLDLNGNTVAFNDKGESNLLGIISGTGSLIKSGTGTWNLDLLKTMNHLTVNAGTVNLQNATSVDNVTLGASGTLKLNVDTQLQTLQGGIGSKLDVNDNVLTLSGTGETYYGQLLGGHDATIILQSAPPEGKAFNWELYGVNQSWTGIIDIQEGAVLRVSGSGALGKFENSGNPGDVGSVILNNSKLSINTYNGQERLGRLEIRDDQYGIVETITNADALYLYDLTGTGDLIKSGKGSLYLIGENANFEGDARLEDGYIIFNEATGIGTGKLISEGAEEDIRGIVVYANQDADSREIANAMNLEQNMTLYYSGVPNLTLSGKIEGNEGLSLQAMDGSGKIILTGDYNDYYGGISLGSGTTVQLGDNVNLNNSTVSIFSTATFNASGTVNQLRVASGGHLQLTSTTGRLNITDELHLTAGAMLHIDCTGTELGQTANGGLITIIGPEAKAVLNGGTVFVNASDIQIGDTFTLIDTLNGGTLDVNEQFSFRDNVKGARIIGAYDEETQRYTYRFVEFDYLESMQTKNQVSLGNYLNHLADNSILTPQESAVFSELESIIAEDPMLGRYLIDEMSGQVYASMGTAQVQGTSLLNQSLATQLRPDAFSGSIWDGTGGMYRGQAFADRGLSAWLSGYGMVGTIDPTDNAAGYDLDVYGGLLGLERCSNNLSRRLGIYYGYGQTKLDTKSTVGKGTSDDNRLGLYLKWDDHFGYGLMSGGVGFNSYKFDRFVGTDKRHTNVNGVQSSFYGERGTSLRSVLGVLQPFVGIQYIYQHQNGFAENGNPFALQSNGVFTNSLRTMVGGRFIKGLGGHGYGGQAMQWFLQGHWMHEYLDQNSSMMASFAANGPAGFEVIGNGPGRDWLVAGTGILWNLNSHASVTGSYDVQWNDQTMLHVGSIGTKIVW